MEYKGINYDTGTKTLAGGLTRETYSLERVAAEISIIKNELHCNAIRISGADLNRVVNTAEIALKLGLTVWFSPSLNYESQENVSNHIIQSAEAAEALRVKYSRLIFVAGCELTLFAVGFVKGETGEVRIKNLFGPLSLVKNILGISRTYNRRLGKFLAKTIKEVRGKFKGQITYASGMWEKVDWGLFDIIGIDHYRSSFNKAIYVKELQRYKGYGKPVSIMEFGCCTYKGAEDKGGMGWAIVDWKKAPPELKGDYIRDEETQAKCLLELLGIFEAEQVFAAFAFTFILENYVYNEKARYDLDMASYGVVKPVANNAGGHGKGLPWLPKQSFYKLGSYYAGH